MMSDTILEIRLPTPLLNFGIGKIEVQRRATEWLVLSLFTEERISSGKAASLLNITRSEFLDLLRQRGIAYLDFSDEELAEEFAAVEALKIQGK
jgi:predicted HTH domain antitoxin